MNNLSKFAKSLGEDKDLNPKITLNEAKRFNECRKALGIDEWIIEENDDGTGFAYPNDYCAYYGVGYYLKAD